MRTLPRSRPTASSTARAERSPTATCAEMRREAARLKNLCMSLSVVSGDCSTTTVRAPGVSSEASTPYWPLTVVQRFAWKICGRSAATARTCREIRWRSNLFRTSVTMRRSVPSRAARTDSPTDSSTASTVIS